MSAPGVPPLPPAHPRAALSATRRGRDLDALTGGPPLDVLVVGGGVTGTGVALDAATRGLSVALVERGDLAQGTSRWSSKLVHGGLRYLAHGDVRIAHESAVERHVLMTRIAPHLVHPLPMLTPLTPAVSALRAASVAAALWSGEALARAAGTRRDVVPPPRRLRTAEAMRLAPALRAGGLRGGLLHWEGQLEDDARLVVAIARTAAAYGARVLTRCAALTDGGGLGAGRVTVRDELTGSVVEVRARYVVNATGVWADALDPTVRLRPSKGSHLVVPAAALGYPAAALSVPVPGETARFALVLPQPDGLCYVGLTDEPHSGPVPDTAEVSPAEVDLLLGLVADTLERPLQRSDVVGGFTGFRPLLATGEGDTVDLSRRHAVRHGADGLVTVTGGKLTTYRRMAEEVVDLLTDRPCRTSRVPLVAAGRLPRSVAAHLPARLVRRYGTEAPIVAALAEGEPALAEPVTPGSAVLGAEVVWSARHEGALTADDVLHRRTRLGLVRPAADAARPTVHLLLDALTGVPAPRSVR
ncbi:MAG: glycerol-3-phosphate dehydrogenase/oxidase [Actinomycetes bacterium]